MSSALAIASVTAVLKDLLNNGLIDNDINRVVAGDVTVSTLPPDRVEAGPAMTVSLLNLFLWHVTPNAAWRNVNLPSRDDRGERIANPPLALDLHYLLTAYGREELDAEVLLGYGMQLLHETPVLSRAAIRRSLLPPSPIGPGGGLPDSLRELATSELAEQFEQIRITAEPLTTEEISKLWTAFGSKYRPTTGYLATVVLIESKASTRTPLPVLRRNIAVKILRQPRILRLREEPFVVGDDLIITGDDLRGDVTLVRISQEELLPDSVEERRVALKIPATLQAGVQGVQVVHRVAVHTDVEGTPPPDELREGPESNLVPFVLRPRVDNVSIANITGTGSDPRAADVTVDVVPSVGPAQRARLLLNELAPITSIPVTDLAAYSFELPSRNAIASVPSVPQVPIGSLHFHIAGVKAAKYLVRVQVDGAESSLTVDGEGRFDGPTVEVT